MENGKINLTKSFIQKLEHPASGKVVYWDSKQPNLALRVTPSKKTFIIRVKVGGRSIERALTHDAELRSASIEQIRDDAAKKLNDLKNGIDFVEVRKLEQAQKEIERTNALSLEGALEDYLKSVQLKERTQMDYRLLMTRELLPYCKTQIKDIDRQMAEDMIAEIKNRLIKSGRGKNGSRANHALRLVRALCTFTGLGCQDWRAHRGRKFPWIATQPKTTDLDPSLGHGQEIWQLLGEFRSDTARDYAKALLLTGARRGELAQALVSDVNLKTRTITFRDTKNGSDHKILMSTQLTEIVTAAIKDKKPDQPIFDNCGEPKKLMASLSQKLGVHVTAHALRKFFAMACMHVGVPFPVIQACLNHSATDVTTRHYARPSPEMLRDAWQRVADLYAPLDAKVIHLDHHRKSA